MMRWLRRVIGMKKKPIPTKAVIIKGPDENGIYLAKLDDGREIKSVPSGKLRLKYIRVREGDTVYLNLDPSNRIEGRIVERINDKEGDRDEILSRL